MKNYKTLIFIIKFTSFWQVKKNMLYLNYVSFMYVCAQWLSHIWLVNPMECCLPRLCVHGILQGKNTGESCHFLLQGIFPTQGSSPRLLHWKLNIFANIY